MSSSSSSTTAAATAPGPGTASSATAAGLGHSAHSDALPAGRQPLNSAPSASPAFAAHLHLHLRRGQLGRSAIPSLRGEADDGGVSLVGERDLDGSKVERTYTDGTRVVFFKNGTQKEHSPSGRVVIRYSNGDVKVTGLLGGDGDAGGSAAECYYYAESDVIHTTYGATGCQAYDFPTGQVEMHWPDGRKEIQFADGTISVTPAAVNR